QLVSMRDVDRVARPGAVVDEVVIDLPGPRVKAGRRAGAFRGVVRAAAGRGDAQGNAYQPRPSATNLSYHPRLPPCFPHFKGWGRESNRQPLAPRPSRIVRERLPPERSSSPARTRPAPGGRPRARAARPRP